MNWSRFWGWVDEDFNHARPYSLILFMGFVSLPLLIAFLLEATPSVVEIARSVSGVGVLIVMVYYVFRATKNIIRSSRDTFGSKGENGNDSDN